MDTETKITLLFYNGWEYGGWIGKLVSIFSLGRYTHVEAYFPNREARLTAMPGRGTYVEWFPIPVQELHEWGTITIECSEEQADICMNYMLRNVNRPYDWLGVFGCVFSWIKHDYTKLFCSEYILEGLRCASLYCGPTVISPSKMHFVLTKEHTRGQNNI